MRIVYRPEIDGLRTVSVFAVILYHTDFTLFDHNLFQGGFVGVDIFFVISGYLITAIILKEFIKTNKFSFKFFYERRIRRILPVLLFVTIITSFISYFILLPSSLISFSKSIISIIFFVSNIYFWAIGGRYGESSELLKPLLHTWSLSVEEQFYFFFPLFLIVTLKFFKKNIITILFFVFFLSLTFGEWSSRTNIQFKYTFFRWTFEFFEQFNFYFIAGRVFEFVLGSFLAYFELNNRLVSRKPYPILNRICPSLGILLIFYSFIFLNYNKIFHPSLVTLIPLIGVSLIIWFSKKGELITEILSNRIFVFFGLISFSLYLWHYPIFAFLRYIYIFNNSIQIKILAIVLTIILSIFTYYFIEKPFRNRNIISVKILSSIILMSVFFLLSYSFYILRTEGIKNRFPNIINEELKIKLNHNELNKVSGNLKNVLLIGDSHSDSLMYHLNKELTKNSYNFYKLSTNLYLKNFNQVNRRNDVVEKTYIEDNEQIDKFLNTNKNLIVIWNQRWTLKLLEDFFDNSEGFSEYQNEQNRNFKWYFQPINIKTETAKERQDYIRKGINLSAKEILKNGNILIIVYPIPEMGFDVPSMLGRKYLNLKILDKKLEIPILTGSYEVYKKRNQISFNILDSIPGSNIYRIYPHKIFCNNAIPNRCVANNKEHLFYEDTNHLSLKGSEYVVNDIIKAIQQIEISKNNQSSYRVSF